MEVELAFFLLMVGGYGLLEGGLLVTDVTLAGRLLGLGLVVLVDGLAGGFRVPHPDGGWLGGSDSGTGLRMSES